MRFNKQELQALASQTSQNFDKEGVLTFRERQDGFFRRSEGCSLRWFRLRGNLLFYLKGPEPWYEPMGVIVLGHHRVKTQPPDENGHWPFQIVWDNGVSYRMAAHHESERTLWLEAIQMAPYDNIKAQIASLRDRLNKIRPHVDIATYRLQRGIVTDMNEVPLCELALSCDNLLCDTHGRPPSPLVVLYVRYPKGLCVRYGTTEVVEPCSNPCFSKTILFRASDGLTGDAVVRIVVYDVKERVSETTVPMGYTSLTLATIQDSQRVRVALSTRENKTVGFVTVNGWSLEPSYIGSPIHTDKTVDIHRIQCHRRAHSLPPRLGLKLKFPSYGNVLKQNFVNSHQVTYRFHSGLGGDITVHEVMAEAKICFQLPAELLNMFIQREKELLEQLLSVGEICGHWQHKQLELVGAHVALLKHYCRCRRCLASPEAHFKPSAKKEHVSLEFAPINLHLQRMWVHNDTLNKSGFHDVITAGAFAVHTNKNERTGGLIRLVQQAKDVNSTKAAIDSATANKIQAEYDTVVAIRTLRDEIADGAARVCMYVQAGRGEEATAVVDDIKSKVKKMITLWDPNAIEESLSVIGWPQKISNESEIQTMCTIKRLIEQLTSSDTHSSDCDTLSSCSSSKDPSPTTDPPPLSSSAPNINKNLEFHNDYFESERKLFNHSFRSVRSQTPKLNEQCRSLDANNEYGSVELSYKCLDLSTGKKTSSHSQDMGETDPAVKESNLSCLKHLATELQEALEAYSSTAVDAAQCKASLELLETHAARLLTSARALVSRASVAHAALRLRCEPAQWTRDHAQLQARRDKCFSQALTTVTAGLVSWLCGANAHIVSLLSSGLGPLCGFEGLLSLYAAERAMWGDMAVAVEDLHTVQFTLTKSDHNNVLPRVSGTRGSLVVHIPISDSLYAKFTNKEHLTFTITAVFFNIGVNEKATLAEALGETTPQYHSNCDNYDRLHKYYLKYCKVCPQDHTARASSRTKPLEEVMENLRIAVHKKVPKNVEVLHLAALATRLMNGIRFTSCKSAKDRTGMSVTLEQCSILASEYHLADTEMRKALAIMRSEGCRRENTFKNIGVRKYAFTKKQVAALPEDYRPPPGTFSSSQT
ncbi:type II inositol 3,4-bisphosphate 4-phosphatase [Cydia splendana]|uniref:type II inositol 3,4-bisphosphate 4-phosphatase n=1 Tax=Cydia splendana TaxID=1100963 RepID=UPI00300D0221